MSLNTCYSTSAKADILYSKQKEVDNCLHTAVVVHKR